MYSEHQVAYFLRELADPEAGPGRREAAVKGLGRIGRPEHSAHLVRATRDPEPAVRAAAAQALGRIGDRDAGAQTLPALMADEDPIVRRRASRAAIRLALDGEAATEAFRQLLRDPDHHLRINALEALRTLGTPGDIPALVRLLGDPDPAVWGRADGLVRKHKRDPAVEAEVVRAAREGTGPARARALDMLPARCNARLHDSLLDALRDECPQVRIAAARRLARTGEDSAADALATALADERDPEAAGWLLNLLGRLGDRRVTGLAARWLHHAEAGPAAAHALGAVDTPEAAARLRAVLDDRTLSGPTRAAAAMAVGESGARHAVWLLLPLLDDADPALRAGAMEGLSALVRGGLRPWERPAVVRSLVTHLSSVPDNVWRTRNVLAHLPQALPAVRDLADRTPSTEVRAAALSLLDPRAPGDRNAREDVRRLLDGLEDPHESVRYQAALGLKRWVKASGTPPPESAGVRERLLTFTTEGSPRLQQAAAGLLEALAEVGR
ncbi:HEAT repeat domain-containing protein [Streptomyces sp. NPDC047081]|uniref:HEAT repeat domain-containing protein n=1 Tax=Streptomyces sp. NPDC047081 TaxID=3154706 RepID=UPI0033E76777